MKVRLKLPNGYAAQAGDDPLSFVRGKYGGWISANLSDRFAIEMEGADHFVIDFDDDDEARAFVGAIGGTVI